MKTAVRVRQSTRLGFLLVALACAVFGAAGLSALEVRTGVTITESVVYANELSWGGSGGSLALGVASGPWLFGGEVGFGGLGAQALGSLGATTAFDLGSGWSVSPFADVLAGAAFRRPSPKLLLGAEAGAHLDWSWAPGWAVGLSTAFRYTMAPGYFAMAPYRVLEIPFGLTLVVGSR